MANRLRKRFMPMGVLAWEILLQGTNEIMFSRSILQEAIAIARELGDKHMLGLGSRNVR